MQELGGHTRDDLAALAADAIPDDAALCFYAVAGSHAYGWAGPDSDVDLRGFHVTDGHRYALLDRPRERVATELTESGAPVDLVSEELRTFGVRVANRDFTVLEALCGGIVVADHVPEDCDALRGIIDEYLPLDLPARYAGMARSNRDAAAAGGNVKRCLYAVRGLLAAHHVREYEAIEVDVRRLSRSVLGDTALVDDLVEAKRSGPDARLNSELAARAAATLDHLAEPGEWREFEERGAFRADVDAWMCDVRGWTR